MLDPISLYRLGQAEHEDRVRQAAEERCLEGQRRDILSRLAGSLALNVRLSRTERRRPMTPATVPCA
jgi:hypothetical protein